MERSDYPISQAVKACYTLQDTALFESVADFVDQRLDDEALNSVIAWMSTAGFALLQKGLRRCFTREKKIHTRYANLQGFLQCVQSATEGSDKVTEWHIDSWIQDLMNEALDDCEGMSVHDAPALVKLVKDSKEPEKTFERIIAAAKRNLSGTPSIIALLAHMSTTAKSGELRIPAEKAKETLHELLIQSISTFDLDQERVEEEMPLAGIGWTRYAIQHGKKPRSIPQLKGETLAQFFEFIFEFQLESELDQVLDKIKACVEKADSELFHLVLIPFLRT